MLNLVNITAFHQIYFVITSLRLNHGILMILPSLLLLDQETRSCMLRLFYNSEMFRTLLLEMQSIDDAEQTDPEKLAELWRSSTICKNRQRNFQKLKRSFSGSSIVFLFLKNKPPKQFLLQNINFI